MTRDDTGGEKAAAAPAAGLRSLLPYVRLLGKHRGDFALLNLLVIAAIAVSLAIPLYAGRFVDALGGNAPRGERLTLLLVLSGLLAGQLLGTYLSTVISSRLALSYLTQLRLRVFTHLLELPCLFYGKHQAGDLSSRLTSDVGSIQYLVTSGLVSLVRALVTLVGAAVLMLRLNVRLTVVILAVVPVTILLVHLFGQRLRTLARRMYDELGQISNHVQEIAGAIRVIKSYNNQEHEEARFQGKLERYQTAGQRRAILAAVLDSASQVLLWIAMIVVVVYGFTLTARGVTTHGELVAFFLLAYRVAVPMSSLTGLYASAQGAVAAVARLDAILETPVEPRRRGTVPTSLASQGELILDRVTFAYDSDEPVIRDFSARIAAGEWIGVVGPSGAGKTTLTGLVLRLFDPQSGRLLLDGQPYTDHDLTDLRAQMAYVSQDPVLYDMSILENIRFGLEAGDEDVRLAAAQANALEFIERLPEGFATRCGERGMRFSGGERQRITLARAFLRNPRILVLDEPTSALDARSEEAVREALSALMAGRTAIVIAHRLSTVRDLDRILVLAQGRLVEEGNHAELLARQGLYSHLYSLQHGVGAET